MLQYGREREREKNKGKIKTCTIRKQVEQCLQVQVIKTRDKHTYKQTEKQVLYTKKSVPNGTFESRI